MTDIQKRRWYDEDATVSLAVSLLEKASFNAQLECAKLIKDKCHCFDIHIESNKLDDAFNYFCKRWYDDEKEISDSFEYLKLMPFELQKEISLDIINKLQEPDID